mmetsp:Transcript_39981/g.92518  ORF Transcript_39981/g.92518 Transcript_39981/m.92518 type:complete len:113 (-) Transcript_39981:2157-2495(-)
MNAQCLYSCHRLQRWSPALRHHQHRCQPPFSALAIQSMLGAFLFVTAQRQLRQKTPLDGEEELLPHCNVFWHLHGAHLPLYAIQPVGEVQAAAASSCRTQCLRCIGNCGAEN